MTAIEWPQVVQRLDGLGNAICIFDNGNSGFCEGQILFISQIKITSRTCICKIISLMDFFIIIFVKISQLSEKFQFVRKEKKINLRNSLKHWIMNSFFRKKKFYFNFGYFFQHC